MFVFFFLIFIIVVLIVWIVGLDIYLFNFKWLKIVYFIGVFLNIIFIVFYCYKEDGI